MMRMPLIKTDVWDGAAAGAAAGLRDRERRHHLNCRPIGDE